VTQFPCLANCKRPCRNNAALVPAYKTNFGVGGREPSSALYQSHFEISAIWSVSPDNRRTRLDKIKWPRHIEDLTIGP
jgi:hypothetical protein